MRVRVSACVQVHAYAYIHTVQLLVLRVHVRIFANAEMLVPWPT